MPINKDTCWKGRRHEWEEQNRTESHIIKKCPNCKGTKWSTRRIVRTDTATVLVY